MTAPKMAFRRGPLLQTSPSGMRRRAAGHGAPTAVTRVLTYVGYEAAAASDEQDSGEAMCPSEHDDTDSDDEAAAGTDVVGIGAARYHGSRVYLL